MENQTTKEEFNQLIAKFLGPTLTELLAERWSIERQSGNWAFLQITLPGREELNLRDDLCNALLERIKYGSFEDAAKAELSNKIKELFHPNYHRTALNIPILKELVEAGVNFYYIRGLTSTGSAWDSKIVEALESEKAFKEFSVRTTKKANYLLLGHDPNFFYGSGFLDWGRGFEFAEKGHAEKGNFRLVLVIPSPNGIFQKNGGSLSLSNLERIANEPARVAGISDFIRYESYHVGTHAPIDEERLVIAAVSIPDMINKLDRLAEDKNLRRAVQQFIFDTIKEVSAGALIPEEDPAIQQAAFELFPHEGKPGSEESKVWLGNVKRYRREQLALPDNMMWGQIAEKLRGEATTLEDFLVTLKAPKPEQEVVYGLMLAHLHKLFPLLAEFEAKPNVPGPAPHPLNALATSLQRQPS